MCVCVWALSVCGSVIRDVLSFLYHFRIISFLLEYLIFSTIELYIFVNGIYLTCFVRDEL